MSDVIRPEYPAKPSNPPQSKGNVGTVGVGAESPLIQPEYPAKPANPPTPQGAEANVVGGGAEKPVVRGGE